MTPNEISEAVAKTKNGLSSGLGLNGAMLVDSVSWYREQFDACGNWDSWIWETVTGRDYATRDRHFDGFVVYGSRLGRASAGIASLAIQNGRAVLSWDGEAVKTVRSIERVDSNDMTAGWVIGASSSIGD